MQQLITDCFNDIVREFEEEHGIDPKTINNVTAVGNTTMSHLLLGIDPKALHWHLSPDSPTGDEKGEGAEFNYRRERSSECIA